MDDSQYGEIYMITNKINSKKYIGQTKCRISGRKYGYLTRWAVHKYRALKNSNECNIFYNSIRKNGIDSFDISLLKKCKLEELDNHEKYYIKEYNTIYPHGYNIEKGGRYNKDIHEITKEKMSEALRFKYIKNKDDIGKIKKIMEELNIPHLPKGIQYSHDSVENVEGFCVIYKNNKKLFSSINRPLKEKLELAMKYYDICKTEDKDKINEFNKNFSLDSIKKSKVKRLYKHEEINKAMEELNIQSLPLYVRFEKRHNRFYIKKPNEPNHCFCKNNPVQSLKDALDFLEGSSR